MISYPEAKAIVESFPSATPLRVDDRQVDEYLDCWYFPVGGIGSSGVIVDRSDGHANWLGGTALRFDEWLWGHRHGFKHDTYDIEITKISDVEKTIDVLTRFGFRFPHVDATPVEWFTRDRVSAVLKGDAWVIRHQRLGLLIPAFRDLEKSAPFRYSLRVTGCADEKCSAVRSRDGAFALLTR
jgi:hypothetical protein